MSKTTLILEALFTGADEAEVKRRDAMAPTVFAQEWMEEFLKRTDIKKNSDGSYDVDGDVRLVNLKLVKLPLKFNHVSGYFWCDNNHLTTLEGAPKTVGGNFSCTNNQKKFTEAEVRAVSNVKGHIYV